MYILGIETSCDDTGIAIYKKGIGLIANNTKKQNIHSKYGGVVPELAARKHTDNIIPLIIKTIKNSGIRNIDINGIAYTAGPGMISSLMVGANVSHALSYSWNIPVIAVNHIEGHILTPMMDNKNIQFPFIVLLVSGGNTMIISATDIGKYKILGKSLDDTVGDTFDKVAKSLGLKYPGGASLSNLAKYGNKNRYIFPIPKTENSKFSFSFSGLKTSVCKVINTSSNDIQHKADIAKAFENTVIKILIKKCEIALDHTGFNNLILAGGVSANNILRKKALHLMKKRQGQVFYANSSLCTDNGAMIAFVGMIRLLSLKNDRKTNFKIKINPNWSIENINDI